jgi:hypothetical protein
MVDSMRRKAGIADGDSANNVWVLKKLESLLRHSSTHEANQASPFLTGI